MWVVGLTAVRRSDPLASPGLLHIWRTRLFAGRALTHIREGGQVAAPEPRTGTTYKSRPAVGGRRPRPTFPVACRISRLRVRQYSIVPNGTKFLLSVRVQSPEVCWPTPRSAGDCALAAESVD